MPSRDERNPILESVYLHNGCTQGKGYSIGLSLSDLNENGSETLDGRLNDICNLVSKATGDFEGPIAINSFDILIGSTLIREVVYPEESIEKFLDKLESISQNYSLMLDIVPQKDMIELDCYQDTIDIFNHSLQRTIERRTKDGLQSSNLILNIHNESQWDHPVLDSYLRLMFMYGQPVIQNHLTSTISLEETRPGNRRKDSDILFQRLGGPYGNQDGSGVHGFVCINLAKLGYDSESENDFFMLLNEQMDLASEILENHRETLDGLDEEYWLYSAIVPLGMNEGLEYLIDAPLGHVAGKAVTYKVMEFLRMRLEEIQHQTGNLYTLESYPSEDLIESILEESALPNSFLTRGTELSATHGNDLWDVLEHQKKLHSMYTGSTLMDLKIKHGLHYHQGCKLLLQRIIDTFGFSYVAVTPSIIKTQTSEMEVSRIDGRVVEVDKLALNHMEENRKRVHYDIKNR